MDGFFKQLTQYYATDWLAMGTTMIWLYMMGNKQRLGFIFSIMASVFWLLFGWLNHSIASVLANSMFIVLNIRGYIKWESD